MHHRFNRATLGKFVLSLAAVLVFATNASAVAVLDTAFGTNGTVSTNIGASAQSNAVVSYADNRVLVVGNVTRDATGQDTFLLRYLASGALDPSFGSGGRVVRAFSDAFESANAVAVQTDGKIVVAGSYYSAQNTSIDFFVARFLPDGTLDSSFGANGVFALNQGAVDAFNAVTIQPDGKIIAAGRTSDNGSAAVVRLNPNGTLDGGFGDGGFNFLDLPNLINEYFGDIAVLPNGQILLGGTASPFVNNQPNVLFYTNILVLLDANGDVVPSFGTQGLARGGVNDFAGKFDFEVLPDGKILTVGAANARFLPNGTLDPTFTVFPAPNDTLAVRRSDGRFFTASTFATNADARAFTPNGRVINRAVNFTASNSTVLSDDRVVFTRIENGTTLVLTRLLSISSPGNRIADYDGDEKSDLAVFRSSTRYFYILNSRSNSLENRAAGTVLVTYPFIAEDYTGDGRSEIAWQLPLPSGSPTSFRYVESSGNSAEYQWGVSGDIPVGGDYDGDGRTDFTVYRPSQGVWYINLSSINQPQTIRWGLAEDKPVPADYDYDGITDIAVYRPSQGVWYIRRSSDGNSIAVRWGNATDIPLTGDFDGDGRADFAVYRPSEAVWYLLQTRDGQRAVRFGLETDSPVPGDYDGDGRTDIAVFRAGTWYILGSTRGFSAVQWGTATDIPVSVRYAY